MQIFKNYNVIGNAVKLKATNPKHFGIVDKTGNQKVQKGNTFAQNFSSALNTQLNQVNELQLTSDEMTQKMAITPNEVNIHDVMIAAEKAQLALNFTKVIRDKLVTAYQSLVNMR